ncbi:hypothetical protein GCM10010211_82130 [Streptomyces albospinus]|uniref:Uncharacterized protein n=1 Tax=Streptomyces albospinus TaxID=285515 RepID=A0ABQ2VRW2_9ACTN|nr:hypothetical protein GCM10010211_82130 [Streptomyces albospinus]
MIVTGESRSGKSLPRLRRDEYLTSPDGHGHSLHGLGGGPGWFPGSGNAGGATADSGFAADRRLRDGRAGPTRRGGMSGGGAEELKSALAITVAGGHSLLGGDPAHAQWISPTPGHLTCERPEVPPGTWHLLSTPSRHPGALR